ncbi:HxlR-like helix-turn-helix [Lacipirellula limnantheis]|uniref:HxlR-like helix-turn-helix n=2 Tax=Lacipirellula limnantheis TaxID=2528024 RepID=A0A517TXV0_9BACT|nr:HxlR-like helix-turn-helix [Lacipirellula limnantheis]
MACGKRHFNEFCRSPERLATNILAERWERLVSHGLAAKHASADQSGRDAYRLTVKGKSFGPLLAAMAVRGLSHVKGTKAELTPSFD